MQFIWYNDFNIDIAAVLDDRKGAIRMMKTNQESIVAWIA